MTLGATPLSIYATYTHDQIQYLLEDSGAGPLTTATFSLVMLLGTQGRQFTYAELAKLLGDAGFTDVGATPSHGYYSVVRATRR